MGWDWESDGCGSTRASADGEPTHHERVAAVGSMSARRRDSWLPRLGAKAGNGRWRGGVSGGVSGSRRGGPWG